MSEKVVRSFEIIETDDGFRIEIKGDDKEKLRELLFGGEDMPFAGFGWRGRGHFGRGGFGHRHMHRHPFHMPMPPAPPTPPMPHEAQADVIYKRKRRGRSRGRGFGGRWEARWGYDLGPWWDEGAMPGDEEGDEV